MMSTSKTLGFSSVVLDAPAIPQTPTLRALRRRLQELLSLSRISAFLKWTVLAILSTAFVLFLGYQAVVYCMIYARVTTFTTSNFATETDELLGTKFTLTRFEPQWQDNYGWVIERDVTRYHNDAYYILPSNTKADTESSAALAIYRQRWGI